MKNTTQQPVNPSLPYISARYMPVENEAILIVTMVLTYNFKHNHNECRIYIIFFSCLFETFVSMSSDSMSKNIFSTAENI